MVGAASTSRASTAGGVSTGARGGVGGADARCADGAPRRSSRRRTSRGSARRNTASAKIAMRTTRARVSDTAAARLPAALLRLVRRRGVRVVAPSVRFAGRALALRVVPDRPDLAVRHVPRDAVAVTYARHPQTHPFDG